MRTKHGIALDGRMKGEDTDLASSTLLADENSRDIFGMVISYTVKVWRSCFVQSIKMQSN